MKTFIHFFRICRNYNSICCCNPPNPFYNLIILISYPLKVIKLSCKFKLTGEFSFFNEMSFPKSASSSISAKTNSSCIFSWPNWTLNIAFPNSFNGSPLTLVKELEHFNFGLESLGIFSKTFFYIIDLVAPVSVVHSTLPPWIVPLI